MISLAWLDESFSTQLVRTLLHFLWQGAIIAIVDFGLEQFLRRGSAQARYALHVVALLAMVCCLPITFTHLGAAAAPGENLASAPTPAMQRREAGAATWDGLRDARREHGVLLSGDSSARVNSTATAPSGVQNEMTSAALVIEAKSSVQAGDAPAAAASDEAPQDGLSWLSVLAPYVTIGYLSCVLVLFGRLALGIWGGHKLRASTEAVADRGLLEAVAVQAERIGLRAAPAIAYCERISVPVVVGILRPMILLPAALVSGMAPSQLEALITHELAHLRRCDPLVNLLQRLAEAVLFFHPAVWRLSRRIRIERENASDDIVLAAGWQRVQYADALVRMAELAAALRLSRARCTTALAASGGSSSEFKRRVMRLLAPEPVRFRLTNAGLTMFLALAASTVAAPFMIQAWAQQGVSNSKNETALRAPGGKRLGHHIDDFELQDGLGAEYSLSHFADRKVVVVAFLGIECPVSKLYGARLKSLAARYKPQDVAIIGVDSNQQDTPTEVARYARTHGITFPLLKDPGNRVADQFGAERTPEAFVLDSNRNVRYWGRVDDQFGVGYARQKSTQNYVAKAIDDLLAGRPVNTPRVESVGCRIGRISRVEPRGDITYAKQISRIIQRRCAECHRKGGIAPFTLDTYDAVAAWAETIREVVEDQRMPPWHANPKYGQFVNDCRMPDAEKDLLYQWVANGVPKGAEGDLPPKREFADGWALGRPDLLLTIPKPITIPSNGVVDYQYVSVDPGFTEGKWVRASEIQPGVRSVVHHIAVFIQPPGGDPILEQRGIGFETVGGYVPGAPPMQLGEGVARYVPPGSKLVFQIHYTPDGVERRDQSRIGLYFADPATVRRTMQTGVAANLDFVIPPGAEDHRVAASHRFSHDMELHALSPHMHYRGKAFRFEATYPNGSREILLDVPRYDFNWQKTYRFAQPKFMPEGTLLRCVAQFDNSEDNLSNPNPKAAVRWGEQTWDEMMIGYFEGVFLNQDLTLPQPQITATGDGAYRVHFTFRPDRPARNVNVAGTFNDWNTSSHPLTDPDGNGVYVADVKLKAGEYRYKFVIDGNYWTHDPASRILTGFLHESFFIAGRELKPQTSE